MQLVWQSIYLVIAVGGSLFVAITASRKGYRDMLWFLAALFWGLIHPVMILIPIALMVLVKDQGKMIAVIDHKRLENEQLAMEKGTITEQVPKTEEIIQLEKKLVTTRRLVNGLAGVLLVAGLVILFAGGL